MSSLGFDSADPWGSDPFATSTNSSDPWATPTSTVHQPKSKSTGFDLLDF
jgi:hypothetical protein